MKEPVYVIDFDRTISLYINSSVYEIKVSDQRYHTVLECIKQSKYDNLFDLLDIFYL